MLRAAMSARSRIGRDWADRRQPQHRGAVRGDPLGRGAAEHPFDPGVGDRQPCAELGVEVLRAGERPSGQEGALQVVVGAFDDALVLGFAGSQHDHLGGQHAPEGLALAGELDPAAAVASDRTVDDHKS